MLTSCASSWSSEWTSLQPPCALAGWLPQAQTAGGRRRCLPPPRPPLASWLPPLTLLLCRTLGFETPEAAGVVRDKYFELYHSTMKALIMASEAGEIPDGKTFENHQLGEWWAANCDFEGFLTPEPLFIAALEELEAAGMKLCIFTNGPRAYALKVLERLEVRRFFADERIFAVEDVLPACKPEAEAFEKVLAGVGSVAERSVMFEDSMKNIRGCKALGMGTVLLTGTGAAGEDAKKGESTKIGDTPEADDPAVDVAMGIMSDIREACPSLWEGTFPSKPAAAAL